MTGTKDPVAALEAITGHLLTPDIYQQILDGLPDGLVVVGVDHRIVDANRTAQIMLGYSREQMVGRPLSMLLPDDVGGRHDDLMDEFFLHPTARPMSHGRVLMARHALGQQVPMRISLGVATSSAGVVAVAMLMSEDAP